MTLQDQWQRKKQTKEEKRAAKKAKLDPENYKSALDVHKEKAQKRKRELEEEGGSVAETDGREPTSSKDGSQKSKRDQKKQKVTHQDSAPSKTLTPEEDAVVREQKAAKRREKRERKQMRKEQSRKTKQENELKKKQKKNSKSDNPPSTLKAAVAPDDDDDESAGDDIETKEATSKATETAEDEVDETEKIELHGFEDEDQSDSAESTSDEDLSAPDTPTFDVSVPHSASSSTSSIVPPSVPPKDTSSAQPPSQISSELPLTINDTPATTDQIPITQLTSTDKGKNSQKPAKLPHVDADVLRERLEARIQAMRAARKADGPDGRPARNRQEMIEARRQKQEKRKQHKKELRAQARKDTNEAEAEAARLRGGSGSPLWSTPSLLSPREPQNNFSFGRVAFDDGAQLDSSLTATLDLSKKKGPQDPRTALEAARKKQQRLGGLDEQKRNDIEEKDRWLNAKKRVQGEKIRDNTSLLKKTLKRKDKGKMKSEREWNERIEGVQKSKEMKQKRREENLQKRRDEKGGKKGGKPAPKPKKRPGFEGSWKLGSRNGAP